MIFTSLFPSDLVTWRLHLGKKTTSAYVVRQRKWKTFRVCSHERSFDNLWRRLAKPITSACERSLAMQFCRSLGQAWPIGGHLPYAKGDAFYV